MQYPDQKPVQFKVILLGESGVGKTSLYSRFQTNDKPKLQQGSSCHCSRDFPVGDASHPVELSLWDTANMERLHSLTDNYFREAEGALLVYDSSDRMSLHAIPDWRRDCLKISPSAQLFLVGNKIDLDPQQFSPERNTLEHADLMAKELVEVEMAYKVSAKEDVNVEAMFHDIAQRLWEARKTCNGDTLQSGTVHIHLETDRKPQRRRKACCSNP